jgi:hypothetical protein
MARTRIGSARPPEQVAAVLRERVYGGIACLITLLILMQHAGVNTSAWSAAIDVAVAAGGLWAVSVVARLALHGQGPRGSER